MVKFSSPSLENGALREEHLTCGTQVLLEEKGRRYPVTVMENNTTLKRKRSHKDDEIKPAEKPEVSSDEDSDEESDEEHITLSDVASEESVSTCMLTTCYTPN